MFSSQATLSERPAANPTPARVVNGKRTWLNVGNYLHIGSLAACEGCGYPCGVALGRWATSSRVSLAAPLTTHQHHTTRSLSTNPAQVATPTPWLPPTSPRASPPCLAHPHS